MGEDYEVGLTSNKDLRGKYCLCTKHVCVNFKENSNLGWKKKGRGRNKEVALWGKKNR